MRRTARIALWTGEEEGLLGSQAYVRDHFAVRQTMELKPEHSKMSVYFNVDNGTGQIRGVYMVVLGGSGADGYCPWAGRRKVGIRVLRWMVDAIHSGIDHAAHCHSVLQRQCTRLRVRSREPACFQLLDRSDSRAECVLPLERRSVAGAAPGSPGVAPGPICTTPYFLVSVRWRRWRRL